jgi:hypothetical protein
MGHTPRDAALDATHCRESAAGLSPGGLDVLQVPLSSTVLPFGPDPAPLNATLAPGSSASLGGKS